MYLNLILTKNLDTFRLITETMKQEICLYLQRLGVPQSLSYEIATAFLSETNEPIIIEVDNTQPSVILRVCSQSISRSKKHEAHLSHQKQDDRRGNCGT